MGQLLKHLMNNSGYIILIAFFISRSEIFRKMLQKEKLSKFDIMILSLLFGGTGVLGTYIGIDVKGAIVNTRNIGIVVGGILGGPIVGVLAGILAATHRILIDIGGITSFPCSVATILGGVLGGIIHKKVNIEDRWIYGFFAGVFTENLSMILILLIAKPFYLAILIVKSVYVPMVFINGVGISITILMTEHLFEAREQAAAKQYKLSLEIANKTLPYFREINKNSLNKVCKIIMKSIKADAVSITDRNYILAYAGLGENYYNSGQSITTEITKRVIEEDNILVTNNKLGIKLVNTDNLLKSAIIAPLKENEKVIGTLKIFYKDENAITFKDRALVEGLSQLISTQFEISRVEKLKKMANEAEIKALQAQINPHFLFNTLNAIASLTRIDANKARELIVDFSTYLRLNLENNKGMVDVYKELEQVKSYVKIEQARFKDKIDIVYDIDENIEMKIPSLIIQPLVENSIKHGILKHNVGSLIKVVIENKSEDKLKIVVEDDGVGIPREIIKKIKSGKESDKEIGLLNVHNRLKLMYGQGLKIERKRQGTRISFYIYKLDVGSDMFEMYNN